MRTLMTECLTLEAQTAEHADEMFALLSDPAIYEYENEPPASLDWLRTRFTKLETRLSADGQEQWLNWVIRLPDGRLAGYVQATIESPVDDHHHALIAYVLASDYWGQNLAFAATQLMIAELNGRYQVTYLSAVLKRANGRSQRLLHRLGFTLAAAEACARAQIEPDELLMLRAL